MTSLALCSLFKPERFTMVVSISENVGKINVGFSVFDQLSYSDNSVPLGNVLSADRIRELFADSDVLFGCGDNDLWNTGLTLWSFIGQVLQDGKGSSCNAAVTNAQSFLKIQEEFGSFDDYMWGFVDGKPIINHWKKLEDIPARTEIAEKMSQDLKKRGFKFVGPTVIYAHMQATGMVNDHLVNCFRWRAVQE